MPERAASSAVQEVPGIAAGGQRRARGPRLTLAGVLPRSGAKRSSGGVSRGATTAIAAHYLGGRRQSPLTLLASRVAQHHVMRPAGAGGFFFRVTRAPIPHTLPECRH